MVRLGRMVLIGVAGVVAVAVVTVLLESGLAPDTVAPRTQALAVSADASALDRTVAPLLSAHDGASGLALVSDNVQAYAVRALSARAAVRGLDLQYYYWRDDLTGSLLAREILEAADRGVRVRLLLDDANIRGKDDMVRALDAHENIEVRVFNPTRHRATAIGRGVESLLRATSDTRRMHNKAWIVDGRVSIVGGRNIGDAYFDAAEAQNFRDMDVLMVGPAVAQSETIFDAFWNSDVVLRMRELAGDPAERLATLRARLAELGRDQGTAPYIRRIEQQRDVSDILKGAGNLHWTAEAEVKSDPPQKAKGEGEHAWLADVVFAAIKTARQKLEIISPYLIPGDDGVADLAGLVAKGAQVTVLTNSLAATDVAAVHGAYASYRLPLLESGIGLYELRPQSVGQRISLFGSSGASLHTKAFTVDGKSGFIGSFNFDPRSASLNTEMGVFFTDPDLAAEVGKVFADEISPQSSYQVGLEGDRLTWNGGPDQPLLYSEPGAGLWRRIAATVIGWLPIESQL